MKKTVLGALLLGGALLFAAAGCQDLTVTAGPEATGAVSAPESTAAGAQATSSTQVVTTVVETGPPSLWTKYELPSEPPYDTWSGEMVFAPSIGKALYFGGRPDGDDPIYSNELWEYDPAANAWANLGGGGPSGRIGHSLVYVPTIDRVICFGGEDLVEDEWYTVYLDDLWSYDPSTGTWTELHPEGDCPVARTEHRMVFDPNTGKVIMFGGLDDDGAMTGLWAYDPVANTWARPGPAGSKPGARFGHAMEYDPVTRKILMYGGLAGGEWSEGVQAIERLRDLWAYDPAASTWTRLRPPSSAGYRSQMQMVYHPGSRLMIMFGGERNAARDFPTNLWAYDPAANKWMQLTAADRIPFGRVGHVMVYDPFSGKIIMFGGQKSDGTLLKGTWTLTP